VGWVRRFARFRLRRLPEPNLDGFNPRSASAYLEFLALERQVSPATQRQALNPLVFLGRSVHGIEDLDFGQGTIAIHDGKGGKHRFVPLPRSLEPRLYVYLSSLRERHQRDLDSGAGEVHFPEALRRKYPNAAREWAWQNQRR